MAKPLLYKVLSILDHSLIQAPLTDKLTNTLYLKVCTWAKVIRIHLRASKSNTGILGQSIIKCQEDKGQVSLDTSCFSNTGN